LQVNRTKLVGLQQAVYVSRCLIKGQRKKEIADEFQGDEQLVEMWMLFLKHNHWIDSSDGRWSLTAKGQAWAAQDETNGDN